MSSSSVPADASPAFVNFHSYQLDSRETIELVRINHRFEPCLLHIHNFVELVYIDKGLGTHYIGNTSYQVTKGDICIINMKTPHRFEPCDGNDLEIINCLINPEFLEREFPEGSDSRSPMYQLFSSLVINKIYQPSADMRLKARDTREVKTLLDVMYEEFEDKQPGYVEVIEGYMKALLYLTLRIFSQIDGAHPRSKHDMIQSVKEYLRDHSCQDVKIDDIARLFFVSSKYLSRIFKQHTGDTIISYLQSIRVEDAIKMLAETNCSTRDISIEVGYNDVTFFYQVFKRLTGITPGEYRERLLNRPRG